MLQERSRVQFQKSSNCNNSVYRYGTGLGSRFTKFLVILKLIYAVIACLSDLQCHDLMFIPTPPSIAPYYTLLAYIIYEHTLNFLSLPSSRSTNPVGPLWCRMYRVFRSASSVRAATASGRVRLHCTLRAIGHMCLSCPASCMYVPVAMDIVYWSP